MSNINTCPLKYLICTKKHKKRSYETIIVKIVNFKELILCQHNRDLIIKLCKRLEGTFKTNHPRSKK